MRSKARRPKTKQDIDVSGRHLIATVQEVSKFKFKAAAVWAPVIRSKVRFASVGDSVLVQIGTMFVADITFNSIRTIIIRRIRTYRSKLDDIRNLTQDGVN